MLSDKQAREVDVLRRQLRRVLSDIRAWPEDDARYRSLLADLRKPGAAPRREAAARRRTALASLSGAGGIPIIEGQLARRGGPRLILHCVFLPAVLSTALARAVREQRTRRLTPTPVLSGNAFEFPARLKLREIVCDVHDVEVPTIVCNVA